MCLGLPGKIESISDADALRTGVVSFDGLRREVCLALVPHARVGDYVIVHAGFAIQVVAETEAEQVIAWLREGAT